MTPDPPTPGSATAGHGDPVTPGRGTPDRLTLAGIVARLRTAGCVYAEEEAALILDQADGAADRDRLVEARVAGQPLEHVLGWARFAGLRIRVAPGVFVPRRRTELMVTQAVALAPAPGPEPVIVLDLCCGSGAVGAAVAAGLRAAGRAFELVATDLDPVAVRCARSNLPASARVLVGDLFAAVPVELRGRVDLLCANVPYVPSDALALMPREARDYEARWALDGGPDGLSVLRRLLTDAPGWLNPVGALLVEVSAGQRPAVEAAIGLAGLSAQAVHDDELAATVVIGRSN